MTNKMRTISKHFMEALRPLTSLQTWGVDGLEMTSFVAPNKGMSDVL